MTLPADYSALSAIIESTAAARRAGNALATTSPAAKYRQRDGEGGRIVDVHPRDHVRHHTPRS